MVPRRANQQTELHIARGWNGCNDLPTLGRAPRIHVVRQTAQPAIRVRCRAPKVRGRATFKAVPSSPQAQILLEKRTAFVRVA